MLQFLYKCLRYNNSLMPAGNNLNLKLNFALYFYQCDEHLSKKSKNFMYAELYSYIWVASDLYLYKSRSKLPN
jgi:hypothetical protein